jgi:hypothetical protein
MWRNFDNCIYKTPHIYSLKEKQNLPLEWVGKALGQGHY